MKKLIVIFSLLLTFGLAKGQDMFMMVVASQEVAAEGVDLLTGLEAYYKFDEASGNAADATGNSHTGVSANIGYGTDGKINDLFTFNGSNANVSITLNTIATGTTFSVSFWIYRNSNGAYSPIISNGDGSSLFYIMADGTLNYYYSGDHNSSSTVPNTTLTHVMLVVNAGSGTYYINNESAGTIASVPTITYSYFGGIGGEWFAGGIDELGIWVGVALSSDQRTALYNSGNGKAFSTF
jgi:hypothetical protein